MSDDYDDLGRGRNDADADAERDRLPFGSPGGGPWRPTRGVKTRIVVWLILLGLAASILGMIVVLTLAFFEG